MKQATKKTSVKELLLEKRTILQLFNPTFKQLPYILLFIFLFAIAAFLRLYRLDSNPPALYQDETAIGYNAYSVLTTGKDEYGITLPFYFKSFNDFKLPVYIYTTSAFIKVFGLTEWAVRLPSAISGVFSVILLFLLVKYLTKNTSLAFLSGFLLAINPWSLQFSRAGFEVNMALCLVLLGLVIFLYGLETKRWSMLFLSVMLFGISLYTYNLTRILSPLFLLTLSIYFRNEILRFKKWQLILLSVLAMVLLVPFLATIFTQGGASSAKGALITGANTTALGVEMRSYLSGMPKLFTLVLYNKYVYLLFQYIRNIAATFSGVFFFVSGTSNGNQGIGNVGTFYMFQLPFFIYGIYLSLSKKISSLRLFLGWLIVCVAVLALSEEVPHATRGYFLVIPGIVFSAVGVLSFFSWLKTTRATLLRYFVVFISVMFVAYELQFYFVSYYLRYPHTSAKSWRIADKNLALYLKDHGKEYNKIIVDDSASFIYTSYLFYAQYPPQKFFTTAVRKQVGDLSEVRSFGKFEFRPVFWKTDIQSGELLIVNGFMKVPRGRIIARFYEPTRYVALAVHDSVVQYPITDPEFLLVTR